MLGDSCEVVDPYWRWEEKRKRKRKRSNAVAAIAPLFIDLLSYKMKI